MHACAQPQDRGREGRRKEALFSGFPIDTETFNGLIVTRREFSTRLLGIFCIPPRDKSFVLSPKARISVRSNGKTNAPNNEAPRVVLR